MLSLAETLHEQGKTSEWGNWGAVTPVRFHRDYWHHRQEKVGRAKLDTEAYICNPNTREVGAGGGGGSGVQGHHQLHSENGYSLGYRRPCLKTTK